ncbi:MAG TPA: TolC family protein [Thiotrichales bacterium]|nr:TolC family protein [Thiotrichales bacterium]
MSTRHWIPLLLLLAAGTTQAATPAPLTLDEAERLAVEQDALSERSARLAEAFEEEAVADEQLPDPRLKLGLANFPTDTFSFTQEPMTQLVVGVQQRFPRGESRRIRGERRQVQAAEQRARLAERRRKVRQETRKAWWELVYWLRAEKVLEANRGLFRQMVEVTEYQYGAGRHNQQDVVRAQLELSRLEDRLAKVRQEQDRARAVLARWIGDAAARRALADDHPDEVSLPALEVLVERLPAHPLLKAEQARIEAARKGVELAEQAYRPGWMLDVSYGLRGGENRDGSARSDFLSAAVMVDLPLFTANRQDRKVTAARRRVAAAQSVRDDRLRELKRMLESQYASWLRINERLTLYRERLVPETAQNAIASLEAYQNDNADFTTLLRARITELNTHLDVERLHRDRGRVLAVIEYLAGEEQ